MIHLPPLLLSRGRKVCAKNWRGDLGWSWSQTISYKETKRSLRVTVPPGRRKEQNKGGWRAQGLCLLTALSEPCQGHSPDAMDLHSENSSITATACEPCKVQPLPGPALLDHIPHHSPHCSLYSSHTCHLPFHRQHAHLRASACCSLLLDVLPLPLFSLFSCH